MSEPGSSSVTELVASEVRAEMARRGLKQRDLAAVLGISQQSVGMRLRGKTPFDVNDLGAIADRLGLALTDLIPPALRSVRTTGATAGSVLSRRDQAAAGGVLPHLDSNQEPAGALLPQVRPRFLSVVRDWRPSAALGVGEESPTVTPRKPLTRAG